MRITTALCGALATGLLANAAARAEDQAPAKADTPDDSAEVTIVGSHIRKDTYNSASPIQVITHDEMTAEGITATAETLLGVGVTNGSAQTNNAYATITVNGGGGVETLSLRGLGATRSLILINGRRVSPAGSRGLVGSPDLTTLPSAMIGHIDVLRDGASAIYGSDAIGGVVNIVTRRADGLYMELTDSRPVHEGGQQFRLSLVGGKTINRFSIQGSAEYYEQQNLTLADRDWTLCNTDYRFNRTTGVTTDYIDPKTGKSKCYPITSSGSNGITINTLATANLTGVPAVDATGTIFNRWRPNPAVTTGLVGFEGVGGGTTTNTNIRDTFDPRMLNTSLISPAKTTTVFTQAAYRLDDATNTELYAELLINHRVSSQMTYRQLQLDFPTGSPLIPTSISSAFPTANFGAAGSSVLFPAAVKVRAFVGFGNSTAHQSTDFTRITAGLRGDLPWLAGWHYDSYIMQSISDATYEQDSFLTDRLGASLVVATPAAGVPSNLIRNGLTCAANNASPSTATCVPAPLLTTQLLGGTMPADWVDYIFRPTVGHTKYLETTLSANAEGPLFNLPAGPVNGAFGVEFRDDRLNDQPSPDSVAGNLYVISNAGPTRGQSSVGEAYAEFNAPLLRDKPGAKKLDLELATRYTQYKTFGSATTYKAGLVYEPVDFLMFRGSTGTSFRAPALYEEYLNNSTSLLSSSNDPCNNYNATGVNPARAANCASEGLPAGFVATNSITVVGQGGATPLKPETSDNATYGVVVRGSFLPEAVGDLALAVDYFSVHIENGISRAGAGNLLSLCYDSVAFRPGGYCNFVKRDPISRNLTVYDAYTNIAEANSKGYTYDLRWNRRFGPSAVNVDLAVNNYTELSNKLLPTDVLSDAVGAVNVPKYTATLNSSLSNGPWNFHYGVDFIGKTQSYTLLGLDPATTPFIFDVPDYYVQNISVRYVGKGWKGTFGIRNLGDVEPPQISSGQAIYPRVGNAPIYAGYDYIGRQVFVTIGKSF
ncbi:MAG TPA: TonB-dependent receptor [Asticcacaulis sp.]|nr:TonB-dependent receptor [Asticcacaulis sp.]